METGDPKQVAILGVVAVAALSFLAMRLMGRSAPPARLAEPKPRSTTSVFSGGILTVGKDPFSHPKLAIRPTLVAQAAVVRSKPEATIAVSGSLPDPGAMPLPEIGVRPLRPSPESPIHTKPSLPPVAVPVKTAIALEALAGATDTVAFLSIDGKESRPYRPHDRVSGSIRLVRIEDGAVVLSGSRGETVLNVGDQKSL